MVLNSGVRELLMEGGEDSLLTMHSARSAVFMSTQVHMKTVPLRKRFIYIAI